jgi:hypothetical protein
LNRYAFVVNNPLKYVDPSGHAEKDPWKESICKTLPFFCQPQSPPITVGEQNEENLVVSQPIVTTGGITTMSASSGDEKGKKDGGGGGLWNLIKSLLGGLGAGGGKKVVDELSKDGDPFDELSEAYKIAKAGGEHAGMLRNYAERSLKEIERAIRSFEKNIRNHEEWIQNPLKKISPEKWRNATSEERQGWIKHWKNELPSLRQELDILRDLWKEKGGSNGGT